MQNSDTHPSTLRVGYVPGVTLTKWRTTWAERFRGVRLDVVEVAEDDQLTVVTTGQVALCFVRLPINTAGLHLIKLYEETPVAWVSKDHLFAAVDEVQTADLTEETLVDSVTKEHLDLVSAGHAVLQVPQSVARSHSRRDLVYRPIIDAPTTTIGLAWLADNGHELIEEFIGVVRGRTANSSRTAQTRASQTKSSQAKSSQTSNNQTNNQPRPANRASKTGPPARGQRRRHH
jgi:DNA-binding transcriptional LysR family regulator